MIIHELDHKQDSLVFLVTSQGVEGLLEIIDPPFQMEFEHERPVLLSVQM